MRHARLGFVLMVLVSGAVMVAAQAVYVWVLPTSTPNTDLVLVEGAEDRQITVGDVRALPCPPLCPVPSTPPASCGGDAQIGLPPSDYVRSQAHTNAGIAAAASVMRRDAAGNPSATGKVGVLMLGMSSAKIVNPRIEWNYNNDPDKLNGVVFVHGATGGAVAANWADPLDPVWADVQTEVTRDGLTPPQVQVALIWLTQTYPHTNGPMTEEQVRAYADNLKAFYPNIAIGFVLPHPYTGYTNQASLGDVQFKVPEPYTRGDSFLLASIVETAGWPVSLHFIDTWTDGVNVNPLTGYAWLCSDVTEPGFHHPSDEGKRKVGDSVYRRMKADPITRGWMFP